MVLAVLTGWLDCRERQAIAYLMEENRVLRRQLGQQRLTIGWLICDRDRKWSREVRRELENAGLHVALTPFQAPNANAHAERCAPRRRREETAM
jgi:hypothetical protein